MRLACEFVKCLSRPSESRQPSAREGDWTVKVKGGGDCTARMLGARIPNVEVPVRTELAFVAVPAITPTAQGQKSPSAPDPPARSAKPDPPQKNDRPEKT